MSTEAVHEHHWEYSWAPLAAALGIVLLVPGVFSAYFVYDSPLVAVVLAGLGTPMLLAGVAKWIHEGMTHKPIIAGVAITGLPIFIISEIFIFLSLFVSYWMMRLKADVWPPEGTPHIDKVIPIIMTIVLVSSSLTLHKGETELEKGKVGSFNLWLIISIILGAIFLGFTIFEYGTLIGEGFTPATNAYSTAFYSITGFHASHVLVGLMVFIALLIPALSGRTNEQFVKGAAMYWHFVDVVWIFVVLQIYFW